MSAAEPLSESPAPGGDQAKARAYARAHLRLSLTSTGVELAALVAFLVTGGSVALVRTLAHSARHIWTQPTLLVLAYTVIVGLGLKLLGLPFDLRARAIESRYQLNRQNWRGWWWDQAKALVLSGALGLAGVELMYWLLRAAPRWWWLCAWAGFTLFVLVMAQLAPVVLMPLFFKFRPLSRDDPREAELWARLERLCARAGARVRGCFEWKLGNRTVKANAALTGWGPTRRIIVSDTLLADSPLEEIEAVLAHELGHHVRHDIWKGLGFQAALGLLGFWLANRVLTALAPGLHLAGIADVAGLPLLILVAAILSLLLLPVANGFSRALERRADDYSFAVMGGAAPLVAGLERLAARNLAELQPARWKELLFYSHPAIGTRIRRARAWTAKRVAQADTGVPKADV